MESPRWNPHDESCAGVFLHPHTFLYLHNQKTMESSRLSASEFLDFTSNLPPCSAGESAYISSLKSLVAEEGDALKFIRTQYEVLGFAVDLVDIKVAMHFEDKFLEELMEKWVSRVNVCPFRRGMCIGCVTPLGAASRLDGTLVLLIGNIKFFHGSDMTSGDGDIAITEKANGEFSLATVVNVQNSTAPDTGETPWLVWGSKNVRLALPYENCVALLASLLGDVKDTKPGAAALRYGMAAEMLPLWHEPLGGPVTARNPAVFNNCLIGEQVGVHDHIFTGYDRPEIRLFGARFSHSLHMSWSHFCLSRDPRICTRRHLS